jgi:tetratricopeptide (TPR) repeat protein
LAVLKIRGVATVLLLISLAGCEKGSFPEVKSEPNGELIKVTEKRAEVPVNYLEVAEKSFAEGDFKKSVESYTAVLKESPNTLEALNGRGLSYLNLGDYKSANSDFEKAKSIVDNWSFQLQNSIGVTQFKQHNYSEAKVSFQKAIEMNSDSVDALVNLGVTEKRLGNHREAFKIYDRAVQMKQDSETGVKSSGSIGIEY